MANIHDYLKIRGHFSFIEKSINEVDQLIFSHLSYVDFEPISIGKTIQEAYQDSVKYKINQNINSVFWARVGSLTTYQLCQKVQRFKDVIILHQMNIIVDDQRTQFSATTFQISNHHYVVAFRGTDETITGWQEDFMLCFEDEVIAQRNARLYLAKIMEYYHGTFDVVGHSKGGNLAVYASCHIEGDNQKQIQSIRNFDGPGFMKHIIDQPHFQQNQHKINNYMTPNSFVGIVLNQTGAVHYIASTGVGVTEHYIHSCCIVGEMIERVLSLSENNQIIKLSLDNYFKRTPIQRRKEVFELIFDNIDHVLSNKNMYRLSSNDILGLIKLIILMPKRVRKRIFKPIGEVLDEINLRRRQQRIIRLRKIIQKACH